MSMGAVMAGISGAGLPGFGGGGLSDSGSAVSSGEQRSSFGGVHIGASSKQVTLGYALAGVLGLLLVLVVVKGR